MNITISTRHFEISDETRKLVHEKISHVNRFINGIKKIEVVLKTESRDHHCEVIVHVNNHDSVVVDVSREDMIEAVDVAVDKIERQLRKVKEKRTSHRRKATPVAAVSQNEAVDEDEEDEN
jgi:putative sigma-54 modulation protein